MTVLLSWRKQKLLPAEERFKFFLFFFHLSSCEVKQTFRSSSLPLESMDICSLWEGNNIKILKRSIVLLQIPDLFHGNQVSSLFELRQ